ncbi:uncharacterized protein LOC127841443 [Dreissena polymorpha]|uniref:Uncharacterized protein n=1 Tax=Dreissena polymorpha TaxID=45954 RepID=A0A9D4F2C3_DREPO|nr:uncharacterized protein LOC127841443 [Dreissena polymorpha]KAH3790081.1 hypothetical protein DPMN_168276 [Dreissena polymorpha]
MFICLVSFWIVCCHVKPTQAPKTVQFLKKIGGIFLDLFSLGADVFAIIDNKDGDIKQQIQELSEKLDKVHKSVYDLSNQIKDLFYQEDLKDKLENIRQFQQYITSRLRELKLIAQNNGTEQETLTQKFKDNMRDSNFEDRLNHFAENMHTLFSGKTILQSVAESHRCNMSHQLLFADYVRELLYSGITVVTAFNTLAYNFTPSAAKETSRDWEERLGSFEDAAEKTIIDCSNKFQKYYLEDIEANQLNKSVGDMCATLHARYIGKLFLIVEMKTTASIFNTLANETLQHMCIQMECGKLLRCFTYTKFNATCEQSPALHLSMKSEQELTAVCTTENWPGRILKFGTDGRFDWYSTPYVCADEGLNGTSRHFKPHDAAQTLKFDGVTCKTNGCGVWTNDVLLNIFVVALLRTMN